MISLVLVFGFVFVEVLGFAFFRSDAIFAYLWSFLYDEDMFSDGIGRCFFFLGDESVFVVRTKEGFLLCGSCFVSFGLVWIVFFDGW